MEFRVKVKDVKQKSLTNIEQEFNKLKNFSSRTPTKNMIVGTEVIDNAFKLIERFGTKTPKDSDFKIMAEKMSFIFSTKKNGLQRFYIGSHDSINNTMYTLKISRDYEISKILAMICCISTQYDIIIDKKIKFFEILQCIKLKHPIFYLYFVELNKKRKIF